MLAQAIQPLTIGSASVTLSVTRTAQEIARANVRQFGDTKVLDELDLCNGQAGRADDYPTTLLLPRRAEPGSRGAGG